MNTRWMIPVAKSPKDYQAFRISSADSNKLALIFDTANANILLTICIDTNSPR